MSPQHVTLGNTMIQWGIVQKTGVQETVDFDPKFKFGERPVVFVENERQAGDVGKVNVLRKVTHDKFVLDSGNAANNYFFNWVAIGPIR